MQHEVTKNQPLLDSRGIVAEEGWARRPLWDYQRGMIKASRLRVKEWEYYCLTSTKGPWSLGLTISDLGYGVLFALAFMDFTLGRAFQTTGIKLFKNFDLAPSSLQDSVLKAGDENISLSFEKKGPSRVLSFSAPKLALSENRVGLEGHAILFQDPKDESMNIATTWKENRRAFYLNEKVNCMSVAGWLRLGGQKSVFQENEVFGVLDWGRGRWTYSNRWFWGSASGLAEGKKFGFNLGYGFSDRSSASENVLFYDGKISKLEDVDFGIPKEGYLLPWHMTSSDQRFQMLFEPALDRYSKTDFLIIKSVQHQVFGYYTGDAVLDGGKVIHIQKFPGFAEDVYNRW